MLSYFNEEIPKCNIDAQYKYITERSMKDFLTRNLVYCTNYIHLINRSKYTFSYLWQNDIFRKPMRRLS